MAELIRHGSAVSSVFDLMGSNENDLTAAFGFALSRSPRLLSAVLGLALPEMSIATVEVDVALEVRGDAPAPEELPDAAEGANALPAQRSLRRGMREAGGRTDLELRTPNGLVVVEAKGAWLLPGERQLRQYTRRIHEAGGGMLLTLSQASVDFARYQLPAAVDGIPVRHLPWSRVMGLLHEELSGVRGRERMWLDQLDKYLQGVVLSAPPEN